ncbi:MAG: hypothetical protein QF721_04505 [Verrucomicrobiota bacterium]|jgi:hypothetical protein|nr:hypothetical protein [Verrucomicrobiota bacterium]
MKHILLTTITVVLLLGCDAKNNMQWTNEKMEPAYALASDLSKATICEVYRVDDSYPNEQKLQNGGNLHGYTIISRAIPLSGKSRNALSQILTNSNTYIRHSVSPDCLFRPGVAFRFTDGSIKVDLLVCYSCNELRYYLNGQIVRESFFESQELLGLTKTLFPDDKKIQSLK